MMSYKSKFLIVFLVLGLTACQSNNIEKPSTYLDLTSSGDFNLENYWIREKSKTGKNLGSLFFPDELAKRSLKGCTEIIFGINSDGKFTGYKTVYSYPEEYVATAAGAHMSTLKWIPGDKNPEGRAVLARAFLIFEMKDGSRNKADFKKNCLTKYANSE
ncbi:hypothetical protein Q5L94_13180 [Idiomarina sp. Sol25]|uniref:hypothetical protein n=1 Tax=Idiomarina sp. Sol25 TaxID=3064000 RepID=UPI00294AEBC2|nr:hypothetical protein [Idiomarina sp. Sol25]MDV6329007.1 hypothetical protein [Idiomarina sp. Sol25]